MRRSRFTEEQIVAALKEHEAGASPKEPRGVPDGLDDAASPGGTAIMIGPVFGGRSQTVESRPDLVALALEWPWELYANVSDDLKIHHDGTAWPVIDVDLDVASFERDGPIRFRLKSPTWTLEYRLRFDGDMKFEAVREDAQVKLRNTTVSLEQFLNRKGVYVHFEQDTLVVPPGLLLRPPRDIPPFSPDRLLELDWSGIDLRIESQGPTRRADSIQARTVEHVLTHPTPSPYSETKSQAGATIRSGRRHKMGKGCVYGVVRSRSNSRLLRGVWRRRSPAAPSRMGRHH